MRHGRATLRLLVMAALVCWAGAASAEEIILKDGQKIVGTIVGYENNMFRVETDYGVALVRKEKVASIQIAKSDDASAKAGAAKASVTKQAAEKPARAAAGPEAAPRAIVSPATTEKAAVPQPPGTKQEPEKPARAAAGPEAAPRAIASPAATEKAAAQQPPGTEQELEKPARAAGAEAAPRATASPTATMKAPAPPAQPAVSHPLDVPLPVHLQEHVEGSTYINDTFQFSMFKPPDWKVYEGVSKETGSGIMAMGAEDEQTVLFVDRQVWSGTPNLNSDQVEAKLRQTYQEYRKISEEPFQCDGLPAIRRTFTGVLDGAEWHGVAVHLARGNMVFGIIGLTSAETFGFQQAIFSKVIKTFRFLTPTPSTAGLGTEHPSP
jgi:hypothetical protein